MRKFISIYRVIVLLASAGAELAAGYLMAFKPQTFFDEPGEQLISLAGSFSVGAFTIGILSILLIFMKQRQTQVLGLVTLILYHLGIGITQAVCGSSGIEAQIFHGWLVISFILVLIKNK